MKVEVDTDDFFAKFKGDDFMHRFIKAEKEAEQKTKKLAEDMALVIGKNKNKKQQLIMLAITTKMANIYIKEQSLKRISCKLDLMIKNHEVERFGLAKQAEKIVRKYKG